jgi:spore germination protein GerM
MKRRAKANLLTVSVIAVLAVAGIALLTTLVIDTPRGEVDTDLERQLVEEAEQRDEGSDTEPVAEVTVFQPEMIDASVQAIPEEERAVPPDAEPMSYALNAYLEKLDFVPEEMRVRDVQVADGLAIVDFTGKPDFGLASAQDQALFEGMTKTLSQFEGVEEVQFLVNGEEVLAFGNLSLTDPLPVP